MAGSELRRLRLLAGQSQYELAREAGIDRARISLAENGHVTLPPDEGKRLARVVLSIMKRKMSEIEHTIAAIEAAA